MAANPRRRQYSRSPAKYLSFENDHNLIEERKWSGNEESLSSLEAKRSDGIRVIREEQDLEDSGAFGATPSRKAGAPLDQAEARASDFEQARSEGKSNEVGEGLEVAVTLTESQLQ